MTATRTLDVSDNFFIGGIGGRILWSPSTITYSFHGPSSYTGSGVNSAYPSATPLEWDAPLKAEVILGFQIIASVVNLNFVDAGNSSNSSTLRLFSISGASVGGVGFYPGTYPGYSEIAINSGSLGADAQTSAGNYRQLAILHEIGHALGLAHPHGTSAEFRNYATLDLAGGIWDNRKYTMMSYNGEAPYDSSRGHPITPMSLDIAALQYMYGRNLSTNVGNTTYALLDSQQAQIAETISIGEAYYCIWDAGSIVGSDVDEIVYAGQKEALINLNEATLINNRDPHMKALLADMSAVTVDLVGRAGNQDVWERLNVAVALNQVNGAGYFSRVKEVGSSTIQQGGFSIASGVQIENAVGGNQGDVLIGNKYDNELWGMDGADVLLGGGGSDKLLGNDGSDHLIGGDGADTIDGGLNFDTAYYINQSPISSITCTADGNIDVRLSNLPYVDSLIRVERIVGTYASEFIRLDNCRPDIGILGGLLEIDGGRGSDNIQLYGTGEININNSANNVAVGFRAGDGWDTVDFVPGKFGNILRLYDVSLSNLQFYVEKEYNDDGSGDWHQWSMGALAIRLGESDDIIYLPRAVRGITWDSIEGFLPGASSAILGETAVEFVTEGEDGPVVTSSWTFQQLRDAAYAGTTSNALLARLDQNVSQGAWGGTAGGVSSSHQVASVHYDIESGATPDGNDPTPVSTFPGPAIYEPTEPAGSSILPPILPHDEGDPDVPFDPDLPQSVDTPGSYAGAPYLLSGGGVGDPDPAAGLEGLFGSGTELISPLVLDLDGDGIELIWAVNSPTFFDLDGDGFAQQTGWVWSDDGLLVYDLNQNGIIDDISELFGSSTVSGFTLLAAFDGNHDDLIDSSDSIWGELKIWQDADLDGLSAPWELKTLAELGIVSLSLDVSGVSETIAGADVRERSAFTWADTSVGKMADVWFATSRSNTIDLRPFELDPAAAALPNLRGYGHLSNLVIAMSEDETLRDMVDDVVSASLTDFSAWDDGKIAAILYRWAGVQGIDPTARGIYIDGRQLEFLEEFLNREFVQESVGSDPRWNAGAKLNEAWDLAFAQVRARLLVAGPLAIFFPDATYDIGRDLYYYLKIAGAIDLAAENAPTNAGERLTYWRAVISTFDALQSYLPVEDYDALLEEALTTSGESTALAAFRQPGTSYLIGTSATEILTGDAGRNLLDGAAGNDTLIGGRGDDAYQFGEGYGADTVIEDGGGVPDDRADVIEFVSGVAPGDIHVSRATPTSNDLVFSIVGSADTLTVKEWAIAWGAGENKRIEEVRFFDSTLWTRDMVNQMAVDSAKSSGADRILGFETADVLDGGAGADTLEGGDGDDTYLFGLGDGHDVVSDAPTSGLTSNVETVVFGAGIAVEDLVLSRVGNDLIIDIANTSDRLTIEDQFYFSTLGTGSHRVEEFHFADTSVWSAVALSMRFGSGADYMAGDAGANEFDSSAGNDRMDGFGGGDLYHFGLGAGSDTIFDEGTGLYDDDPDRIVLGAGITTSNIRLNLGGTDLRDLVITVDGHGDQIVVDDYFYLSGYWAIEELEFADSTVWTRADISLRIGGGTSGNDTIYGSVEANLMDGGAGNDRLEGKGGADRYIFGLGYGQDVINDYHTSGTDGPDAVEFGAGIEADDLTYTRQGENLLITIAGSSDTLKIENQFATSFYDVQKEQIEELRFTDDTIVTAADIRATIVAAQKTSGNDSVVGFAQADTLDGAAGNDRLEGAAGGDTYKFGLGSGQDVVYDYRTTNNNDVDTIEFGAGIAPGDIGLYRGGAGNLSLIVTIAGASDRLMIESHFAASGYHTIEQFKFEDNTIWNAAAITAAIGSAPYGATLAGSFASETLTGTSGNDVFFGDLGNDLYTTAAGSDTFVYKRGDGNDKIDEESGSTSEIDTLKLIDLNPSDITVSRVGIDVIIKDNVTGQTIEDDEHFYSKTSNYGLDKIEFANGTNWDRARINQEAWVRGTSGNDSLAATDWDDTYFGGLGNDTIVSTVGNDTFIYRRGDGNDKIDEENGSTSHTDVLKLVDLNMADVTLAHASNTDLMVRINASGETIEVDEHFWSTTSYYGIERLEFDDTTWMNRTEIDNAAGSWTVGTSGAETQNGTAKSDILMGLAGNDTLSGLGGNDLLEGGDGDDTLDGGAGNDYVVGSVGNDEYRFGAGDGLDRISNRDASSSDDRLVFDSGIDYDELWLEQSGDDLLVSVMGTSTDKVRVEGWFGATSGQTLDRLVAGDGYELLEADVAALVTAMASFTGGGNDPAITYYHNLPTNVQTAVIAAWAP